MKITTKSTPVFCIYILYNVQGGERLFTRLLNERKVFLTLTLILTIKSKKMSELFIVSFRSMLDFYIENLFNH